MSWRKSWVLFVFGSGWFRTMRRPGQLVRLEQDLQGERPRENRGKADTSIQVGVALGYQHVRL